MLGHGRQGSPLGALGGPLRAPDCRTTPRASASPSGPHALPHHRRWYRPDRLPAACPLPTRRGPPTRSRKRTGQRTLGEVNLRGKLGAPDPSPAFLERGLPIPTLNAQTGSNRHLQAVGGVPEWLNGAVLKTGVARVTGGSNPSASAKPWHPSGGSRKRAGPVSARDVPVGSLDSNGSTPVAPRGEPKARMERCRLHTPPAGEPAPASGA